MVTSETEPTVETADAYNTAIVKILDARKNELRKTFVELETASGINLRTIKRLLKDERPMRMGQFIALVTALELDPSEVVATVEKSLVSGAPRENSKR